MSRINTQYVISLVFLLFAMLQAYLQAWWEVFLYVGAGLAFGVMGLIREGRFKRYEKFLNVLSWVLIGFTIIYFFFLVRTDG